MEKVGNEIKTKHLNKKCIQKRNVFIEFYIVNQSMYENFNWENYTQENFIY